MAKRFLIGVLVATVFGLGSIAIADAADKTDKGYIFAGPRIKESSVTTKAGVVFEANCQRGIIVSENPEGPWHQATFFSRATTVKGPDGKAIGDVAICETTDPDGDSAWMIYSWWYAEGSGSFRFYAGTGKWEGINGEGKLLGMLRERADGYTMPKWELSWSIQPYKPADKVDFEALVKKEKYTDHDKGFSFHGPHAVTETTTLSNGLALLANIQSGVIISENPNSPRHYAVGVDHGTSIKDTASGKTLGDVVLIRCVDPDGDATWLAHWWFYGKGSGNYQFIGGTGKWKGITGVGRTLGMLLERKDDWFMLNWEFWWRIDR